MWSALIPAAASLAGGLIGSSDKDEDRAAQQAMAAQNIAAQREFAQMGVRWKVADAQAAGIHPLAALGAQTASFSPVSIGSDSSSPMGDALRSAGQDVGRAVGAMQTKEERAAEVVSRAQQLEKGALENDLLRSQIRRLNSTGTGPGIPTIGKGKDGNTVGHTISLGAPVKEDKIEQKAEDYPATGVNRPFGYPLKSNPYFGDAQSHEDRYGENEVASMLKWAVNMLADHAYTGYRFVRENQGALPNPYRVEPRRIRVWKD